MKSPIRIAVIDSGVHASHPHVNGVAGGVFPAGVYLGKVKSFQTKDVSAEATVEPAVDFSLLEDVFVVQLDN